MFTGSHRIDFYHSLFDVVKKYFTLVNCLKVITMKFFVSEWRLAWANHAFQPQAWLPIGTQALDILPVKFSLSFMRFDSHGLWLSKIILLMILLLLVLLALFKRLRCLFFVMVSYCRLTFDLILRYVKSKTLLLGLFKRLFDFFCFTIRFRSSHSLLQIYLFLP